MNFAAEWTAALLDPELTAPDGLKSWNASDPATRFAVYRNNVTASLISALADTFPVTQELVGEDCFRAMAREFVRRVPPRSALLADYGGELPQFIAGFPPANSQPYLADMTRLELAYVRAYHAADANPLSAEQLQLLLADADALAGCRLQLHPSLHWLRSAFAIVSLWAAHRGQGALSAVDTSAAENAWIMRSGLQVSICRMRDGDCHFASLLRAREPLERAANTAQALDPDFDLSACLAVMLRQGLIVSVHNN